MSDLELNIKKVPRRRWVIMVSSTSRNLIKNSDALIFTCKSSGLLDNDQYLDAISPRMSSNIKNWKESPAFKKANDTYESGNVYRSIRDSFYKALENAQHIFYVLENETENNEDPIIVSSEGENISFRDFIAYISDKMTYLFGFRTAEEVNTYLSVLEPKKTIFDEFLYLMYELDRINLALEKAIVYINKPITYYIEKYEP